MLTGDTTVVPTILVNRIMTKKEEAFYSNIRK
jgi:hypothetical protein